MRITWQDEATILTPEMYEFLKQRIDKDKVKHLEHTGTVGNTCACAACMRVKALLQNQPK